jgi:bacterioferritin-associated ferredoxin
MKRELLRRLQELNEEAAHEKDCGRLLELAKEILELFDRVRESRLDVSEPPAP